MRAAKRSLVTEAEFLALPESMTPVELLDGEVIVSPAPSFWHQELLRRIVLALGLWKQTRPEPLTVGQAPTDVRFSADRILQPDAFVLFAAVPKEQEGPLNEVPQLCIEILSGNRVYDRVTKRIIYAAAGVQELWLVEPAGLVEVWTGPNLARAEEAQDRLESPLLPGFSLDLVKLFSE